MTISQEELLKTYQTTLETHWSPDNDGSLMRGTAPWLELFNYAYIYSCLQFETVSTRKMGLAGDRH